MNEITLYTSNVRGLASNTKYNRKISITNIETLRKALSVDYVPVAYKDNTRSIKNFISSNCIIVDLDNDHSDNEADFIDINKVKEAFPDVSFYVHYSRNNMKPKNGKLPRPKFHIIFFCNEIADKKAYSKLKQEIYDYFPYIDNNALDSARFFFGTENPQVEYVDGEITIDEFIKDKKSEEFLLQDRPIVEGTRNATLHKSAVKILKRYGNTDESYSEFLKLNERCSPPLEDSELNQIWSSALKYYKDKIETSYYAERYFPEKRIRYVARGDRYDSLDPNSHSILMKFAYNDMYIQDISQKIIEILNNKKKQGKFMGGYCSLWL